MDGVQYMTNRYILDIPDKEFGRKVLGSETPLKSTTLPPLVFRTSVVSNRRSPLCNDVEERLVEDRIPSASSEQYTIAKAKFPSSFPAEYFIFKQSADEF